MLRLPHQHEHGTVLHSADSPSSQPDPCAISQPPGRRAVSTTTPPRQRGLRPRPPTTCRPRPNTCTVSQPPGHCTVSTPHRHGSTVLHNADSAPSPTRPLPTPLRPDAAPPCKRAVPGQRNPRDVPQQPGQSAVSSNTDIAPAAAPFPSNADSAPSRTEAPSVPTPRRSPVQRAPIPSAARHPPRLCERAIPQRKHRAVAQQHRQDGDQQQHDVRSHYPSSGGTSRSPALRARRQPAVAGSVRPCPWWLG